MENNEIMYPSAIGETKSFYYLLFKGPSLRPVVLIHVNTPQWHLHCSSRRRSHSSAHLQDSVHAVLKHCGEVGPGVLELDAA